MLSIIGNVSRNVSNNSSINHISTLSLTIFTFFIIIFTKSLEKINKQMTNKRGLHRKNCSRGKLYQAAGELVFCVNNPAVFLRKILGLFSMAKRQNSSMQPDTISHSALFSVQYPCTEYFFHFLR